MNGVDEVHLLSRQPTMAIVSGKIGREALRNPPPFWTEPDFVPKDWFPFLLDAGVERRDHSEPDGARAACAFLEPIGSLDVA